MLSAATFVQLFDRESCTYTYLLADAFTKDAVLIDPVIQLIDRDLEIVKELGLNIRYACMKFNQMVEFKNSVFILLCSLYPVSTHMHSDHTTTVQKLKKYLPLCKTAISAASGATADVLVRHGDIIRIGRLNLEVRATPGHTNCKLIEHGCFKHSGSIRLICLLLQVALLMSATKKEWPLPGTLY